ncbi:MAG: hypothetical protein ABIO65_07030 [Nitrospiria bacterium]
MFVLVLLSLAACVQSPSRMATQPREAGEVIDLRIGYPEAFDRVVRALEREGYEIDAADERVGVIRTVPKAREGAGGVAYKVAVMVRMGGTDRESWLAVDQVAIPTFPEDEKRLKEILKGIDR